MWWTKEIDYDTAKAFLDECHLYTEKKIQKYLPEIPDNKRLNKQFSRKNPFLPIGAVIHPSKTNSVWDCIRSISYGSHGTHFIINNHNAPTNTNYELFSKSGN